MKLLWTVVGLQFHDDDDVENNDDNDESDTTQLLYSFKPLEDFFRHVATVPIIPARDKNNDKNVKLQCMLPMHKPGWRPHQLT